MTSGFLSRRLVLLATLATSALVLAACGGSDDDDSGTTNLRAINLTTDVASIDIFNGDSKQFGAVTTDTLTPSTVIGAGTYTLTVKRAGDGAALFSSQYGLAKNQHYTAVVWGRESALRLATLPEDGNANEIGSGNSRVRMYNATIDSGSLDVFFTSPNAELGDTPPTQGVLTAGALGGFRDISAGTYRLRVTGAGDPSDVRLDIPAITLTEKQYATLVLTATGSSGVLLNGTLIVQQGARTAMKNTKARMRLAASVANSGVVGVAINGDNVFSAYRSPRVSAGYALVDSGTANMTVSVNGSAVPAQAPTFAAGADYTLLVYGTAADSHVSLITDDNRVPSATTRAKLRLVNGLASSDLLTLSLDFQNFVATSDVGPGTASAYATPTVAGTSQIEINSPSVLLPLYTVTAPNSASTLLNAQGVYTVFMLDGQAQPAGRFVRDR